MGPATFGGNMTKVSTISPSANISESVILFSILLVLPFEFSIMQLI
jgi:hypothetical protein